MEQAVIQTGYRCHGGNSRIGDPLEESERRADLERELCSLADEDLLLLLFSLTPDTTQADLSMMTGLPVPTIKQRLRKIRGRLKERLLN